jgi:hypothetical protein
MPFVWVSPPPGSPIKPVVAQQRIGASRLEAVKGWQGQEDLPELVGLLAKLGAERVPVEQDLGTILFILHNALPEDVADLRMIGVLRQRVGRSQICGRMR